MLAKTIVTAPIDGVVIARYAHAGETIAVGNPLIGQRVEVRIDGH